MFGKVEDADDEAEFELLIQAIEAWEAKMNSNRPPQVAQSADKALPVGNSLAGVNAVLLVIWPLANATMKPGYAVIVKHRFKQGCPLLTAGCWQLIKGALVVSR